MAPLQQPPAAACALCTAPTSPRLADLPSWWIRQCPGLRDTRTDQLLESCWQLGDVAAARSRGAMVCCRCCPVHSLLGEEEKKLDFILQLSTQKLLERRLQTKLHKMGLAKSVHMARVMIRQRHIRVGKQLVNVPSFLVRVDSERHIGLTAKSAYGSGRPGRLARKRKANKDDDGEESD